MLNLLESHRFRHPISVDIYHPLNDVAVNSIPPQSKSMFDTAGRAYHLRLSSANQSYLNHITGVINIYGNPFLPHETKPILYTHSGCVKFTSTTNSFGKSK